MKKFAIVCSVAYAMFVSADLWAQTRGPRYNPPSGGSRSGGSSSGSSRGSSYNPPSRSSGSSSSSGPSRGSSYNPPSRSSGSSSSGSSSSGSRGPRYNPPSSSGSSSSGPSSSSSTPRGPRYNPPSTSGSSTGTSTSSTPRGPRYNPPSTSSGSAGGVSIPTRGPRYNPPTNAPRGPRYNPKPFSHTPVLVHTTVVHYPRPQDYFRYIHRYHIYHRWVQVPVMYWYYDGYWVIDGYPYYVNRGYRYRYNPVEMCQYELVDAENYTTVKTYPEMACNVAYDTCAVERDTMNRTVGLDRYFCAEAVTPEYEVPRSEYRPTTIEMTYARRAAINAYLEDMGHKEIFQDGLNNGVGVCSIMKVGGIFAGGNDSRCKYQVNVNDKAYPAVDGSVCSDASKAAIIGCDVGNEKENAGCILQQAIESGYCL